MTHLLFGNTISLIDLENQQRYLRCLKIDYLLAPRYHDYNQNFSFGLKIVPYDDFANRLYRGLWQTMIDSKKNLFPQKELVAINGGGMTV